MTNKVPAPFVIALTLLATFSAPLYPQRRVDERNLGERLYLVVPMHGTGTLQDVKRPLYVPTPEERARAGPDGILSYTVVLSDDKRFALVELVARDRKAFEAILKDTRADVKKFDPQKGSDKAEDIEVEFRKYKKDFDFKKFPGGPIAMRAALVLLTAASAAQAQYYFTDNFASWNSGAWAKNGSPVFGGSGLQGDPNGYNSSLIAYNNGGDFFRHEIRATFANFQGSGFNSVDLYLVANATLTTGYRLAFRSYWANAVTLDVYDIGSGSWTSLGGDTFSFNPSVPTVVRAIKATNGIRVVIGNQSAWIPASGYGGWQGVGFTGGGNGPITLAELAAADTTAPGTVGAVAAWATGNQVDLQWTAATDNAGGSGVFRYNVYRNSVLIGSTRGLSYSDPAVSANTTYTYTVKAEDFFTNEGAGVNKNATTTPNLLKNTGVRPLGSYWGGGGESIDMQSGNLNYTMGLLKAQGRHGLGMGFALNYNSQTWRFGDGQTWNSGTDVGYGYGFKLLAGSIYPVYNGGSVNHYIFTDPTGAEYRMDVSWYGHYWTKGGILAHFDPATNKLWFTDGSVWTMGAVSAAPEQDAGTRYPTRFQDSNGNLILIGYKPAIGSATADTSARIDWIRDVRTTYPTVAYQFTYSDTHDQSNCGYTAAESIPRLTSIATALATSENYSFTYQCMPSITSPFTGAAQPGKFVTLGSRTVVSGLPSANLTTAFTWTSGLELSKVTYPYGGWLRWSLATITAPSGQQVRGVSTRYLKMAAGTGGTEYTYSLTRDVASGYTEVNDADGKSRKRWEWETNSASGYYGLTKAQKQIALPGPVTMRETALTWTLNPIGIPYIQTAQTTIDPGQSYQKITKSEQTIDLRGNLTQTKLYDFGNLSTPKWEYNHTYLWDGNYETRFIWNRRIGTTLKFNGGAAVQYFQAGYDSGTIIPRSGLDMWDPTYAPPPQGTQYRGNVTSSGVPGFPQMTATYDSTGMPVTVSHGGTTTTVSSYDAKNVAPTQITTGSLSVSMWYNAVYQNTQTTGPNGATTTETYDAVARPATETAATGAVTTLSYSLTAPQVTATVNGRWTRSYLDGLGRAVKVESGNGGTVVSAAETVFEPCGCSPMGKVKRVSRPYAGGGSATFWTVYEYDAAGRTVMVKPGVPTSNLSSNGTGATTTLYQGNKTRVTSPTSKWKEQEVDAAGNVTKVIEPNPAGGNYETTYAYNDRSQVLTVTMPRPSGTQVRSFTYNNAGQVLTATNPENGTTAYTYSGTTALLSYKIDAKGNKVEYYYDSLKRATQIRRFVGAVEQLDQRVNLVYDSGSFGSNHSGRLASVEFWSKRKAPSWVGAGSTPDIHFVERYGYDPAGLVSWKRLDVDSGGAADSLDVGFGYDAEGRMTSQFYPAAQPSGGGPDVLGEAFAYGFDAMGRPNTMTSNGGATNWIAGVTYNAAGAPTVITAGNANVAGETRAYNDIGQLTSIAVGGQEFRYNFSATANDGRITSQESLVGGVSKEVASYTYDSLNRLTNAGATGVSAWSAGYTFDGFNNLLGVSSLGTGPSQMNITVNSGNNRVNGWTYDANGNTTARPGFSGDYDVENRLLWGSGPGGEEYYGYGPDNRRVYQSKLTNAGTGATQEIVTWWSGGKRAARYELAWSGTSSFAFKTMGTNVWFGGKALKLGSETNVRVDRLGSVRRDANALDFFPYGQERGGGSSGDAEKYATYMHDGRTDLAYADQRYYATGTGRFMTVDPAGDGSNWYGYVGGDPVNRRDQFGLEPEPADGNYHVDYYSSGTVCVSRFDGEERKIIFCRFPDPGATREMYVQVAEQVAKVSPGKRAELEETYRKLEDQFRLLQETLSKYFGSGAASRDCLSLLEDKVGIRADLFAQRLQEIQFHNGFGSATPLASTLRPGTAAHDVATQRGFLVGSSYARQGSRTTAQASLNSPDVWLNPWRKDAVAFSLRRNAALLIHETLHTFNLDDTELQLALGIPRVSASANITDEFRNNCLTGLPD